MGFLFLFLNFFWVSHQRDRIHNENKKENLKWNLIEFEQLEADPAIAETNKNTSRQIFPLGICYAML